MSRGSIHASLAAAGLLVGIAAGALGVPQASPSAPPASDKRPVTDTYHGVAVRDDYRWLEDPSEPEVRAWSDAQNAYARGILDRLPSVTALRARLKAIASTPSPSWSALVRRGDGWFALKSEPPKQQPFIVRVSVAADPASERIVVDPNALDPTGGTEIDWFIPSVDGRLVAVSLSKGGSEAGDVHVFDAQTGRPLADVIPRVNGGTAGGGLAWNDDGSGFVYTRYPRGHERSGQDVDFYQQVFMHRLGTPTESDSYETGKDFPRIAETTLHQSDDGRYVLATVKNGDGGEASQYLRAPDGAWSRISADEDRAITGRFAPDGSLELISRKDAPRGRILRLAPGSSDLSRASVLVEQGPDSIDDFCPTAGTLYVAYIVGGPSRVRVFSADGAPRGEVPLLPDSSVSEIVWAGGDEILFDNQSYTEPPSWYRTGPAGRPVRTGLRQTAAADFSDVEVSREMAASKDGTKVPVDVLRRKGAPRDGNNPTVLYGYGGYSISQRPSYNALRKAWLEQGGIYAFAGIRGGAEYGDDWHQAGKLLRKQNVFDDFAAAARQLIASKWTRPARLAIEGWSNGGLLVGASFTQHPELFGAVISHVGIYDMLRWERSSNGAFNVTEFGSVEDPAQFRYLYAYSPYHHVADGAAYPPILFLTGANDPRVDPMHSRKMAARLQAATNGKTPVLLRTSASSGHGFGSSLDEKIGETLDVDAFLLDRLGVTYKPVNVKP
ncbi:MAG TPA: prolyl oligopeptidase family serine peptidase [Thermoanaerobaculia bacterium]|nr:prolyl oligopeptidase family serine peptidase [Thermoanaerobaculia bacterium]